MERATISRIEAWDTRSVAGGYVGLNELADDEFTGVVSANGANLFMLNGRIVGVENGSVSSFEDADATAYESPHASLPLLFAMQDHGGEVRGSYYTDDTPIREVDQTLTEGGFTGYLELSENVLSGDYYVVYYGGRSLAAAFVGNKGRVVTGDEAFDLAADEVGIYEVTAVDLDVAEVPSVSDEAVAAGAADATEEESVEDEPSDDEPTDEEGAPDEAAVEEASDEDAPADEDEAESSATDPEDDPDDGGEPAPEPSTAIPEAEDDDGTAVSAPEPQPRDESADSAEDASTTEATADGAATAETGSAQARAQQESATSEPDERFEEEARWREARTVPALDPEDAADPLGDEQLPVRGEREVPGHLQLRDDRLEGDAPQRRGRRHPQRARRQRDRLEPDPSRTAPPLCRRRCRLRRRPRNRRDGGG